MGKSFERGFMLQAVKPRSQAKMCQPTLKSTFCIKYAASMMRESRQTQSTISSTKIKYCNFFLTGPFAHLALQSSVNVLVGMKQFRLFFPN